MTRAELEHAIRAAGAICGDRELYVVGSQAILGAFPDATGVLVQSMEANLAPKNLPELESLVEGSIGELSPFHQTFGFYVDGVDVSSVALPVGWRERVLVIDTPNTNGYRGLCLSPGDLAASKLVAGREKDLAFVRAMMRARMVAPALVRERLVQVPNLSPDRLATLEEIVRRLASS